MKKALVFLSCLWLLGCATANVSLFDSQKKYEPVAFDQVALYLLEHESMFQITYLAFRTKESSAP
jgi:hypothetical protein